MSVQISGETALYFLYFVAEMMTKVAFVRSHSPAADSREATLDYYRSITSTMEETEQIHSAYKKVLNE